MAKDTVLTPKTVTKPKVEKPRLYSHTLPCSHGQPVIEHRDGSCGTAFQLEMTGAVVERAEIAQPPA